MPGLKDLFEFVGVCWFAIVGITFGLILPLWLLVWVLNYVATHAF